MNKKIMITLLVALFAINSLSLKGMLPMALRLSGARALRPANMHSPRLNHSSPSTPSLRQQKLTVVAPLTQVRIHSNLSQGDYKDNQPTKRTLAVQRAKEIAYSIGSEGSQLAACSCLMSSYLFSTFNLMLSSYAPSFSYLSMGGILAWHFGNKLSNKLYYKSIGSSDNKVPSDLKACDSGKTSIGCGLNALAPAIDVAKDVADGVAPELSSVAIATSLGCATLYNAYKARQYHQEDNKEWEKILEPKKKPEQNKSQQSHQRKDCVDVD